MDIVHVSAEIAPFAKVGGLGDMVFGLARAQKALGHRVRTMLPKYSHLDFEKHPDLILVKDSLFEGKAIYGGEDETERFVSFCHKAAKILQEENPDIVHLHDWEMSLIARLPHPGKTFLTINNFAFQGKNAIVPGCENLLLAGVEAAEQVTTVSPSYLEEILKESSELRKYKEKMHGILNGIDYDYWNPETDPQAVTKNALCRECNLDPALPLFASVSRLVEQKGPKMIADGARFLVEQGANFILLGSFFDRKMEAYFTALAEELRPTGKAFFYFGYDEPLSHRVFSGADALFVPSIFEPCGLTQMIALRYGTLPVVRATGGLKDTVFEGKNGFTFVDPRESRGALSRALQMLRNEPKKWAKMVKMGKGMDLSWKHSAGLYNKIYKQRN